MLVSGVQHGLHTYIPYEGIAALGRHHLAVQSYYDIMDCIFYALRYIPVIYLFYN